MLAPAMLILLALTIFPSIYMFVAAVTRRSARIRTSPGSSSAADNFLRLLTDEQFHIGLWNTLVFTVFAVSIEFLLGLGLALLLDKYIRRLNFLKTMLMLPMMLPPIAVAITWKLIYEPQFGVLNEIMFQLGLPLQAWAGDANLAMFSIIVADVWQWTPFIFLLMLAGLASLPAEPYEAAAIDGASAWRQFWDLTLPFLQAGHRHRAAAAHHGRAPALRPRLHPDRRRTGRPHQDAQPLHLSGGLSLRRSELCGGDLALRAVRDGRASAPGSSSACGSRTREMRDDAQPSQPDRASASPSPTSPSPSRWSSPCSRSTGSRPTRSSSTSTSSPCRRSGIPTNPTLKHYYATFVERPFLQYALNSLIIAVATTIVSLVFGTMAGYALARFQYPGQWRYQISFWILSTRMMPPIVTIIPLYLALQLLSTCSTPRRRW